jgi:hypothetical protein
MRVKTLKNVENIPLKALISVKRVKIWFKARIRVFSTIILFINENLKLNKRYKLFKHSSWL